MRNVVVMVVVAGLFLAAEHLGAMARLGADPVWSQKILYMGIGGGIVLTVIGYAAIQYLEWDRGRVVGLFLILAVLMMVVAINGKSGASTASGEFEVAKQFWQGGFVLAVAAWYASFVGALSR